ncbi:unnamed protein product [Rotaria sp. Silwood2]|nr:unnamed protein product [Rotaria sp. Silwood2]CAF2613642.1 unnamed protein product [Rotaria sp. Silwood2]CAF2874982.1 unnamed protein product [Rotaria sp. Silwood2]CAF3026973.1 unnamed protein product [Rotaria sp. Silwood2]CAF3861112.1 unnamed protein product [Rotaria sp. Silwood2]
MLSGEITQDDLNCTQKTYGDAMLTTSENFNEQSQELLDTCKRIFTSVWILYRHENVKDNCIAIVWKPAVVKMNAITAGSETVQVVKSLAELSNNTVKTTNLTQI